jgi:hypothetical protein
MGSNMSNDTFLYKIDEENVKKLMGDTDSNVSYFNSVMEQTADRYTKTLDEIMIKLNRVILSPDDISIEDLEKYLLELTNTLYFIGAESERLGVYDDMSKAAQKEVYNRAYLNNQVDFSDKKKPTVAENQAVAEQKSQYESVVNSIYNHASKIVKYKIEAAYEMASALKKIVSRRMQEENLSSMQSRFGVGDS